MNDAKRRFKKGTIMSLVVLFSFMAVMSLVTVNNTHAQEEAVTEARQQQISAEQAEVNKFGLLSAAIAFGFGAIGAGIAIANVGSAAMGAIGEKPEIASQALIFIALAEGLVVFGFIAALMILGKF